MTKIANWFRNEESGQGMIEYALIIGLISIAAIAILTLMGPKIANLFKNVNNQL